jgi:hypothetical protein
MVRTALALFAVAALAGVAPAAESASPRVAQDVRLLATQLESVHPNLFRHVSRQRFRSEVAALVKQAPNLSPHQLLVGLMRIAALPGPRNGHTGLFPHPGHRRQLHLYPLRLYDFVDGLYVVDASARGLTGSRLVAVGGMPVERVLELVRPLVPRDNDWSLRGLAPHYLLVAEVLVGLGIASGVGPLTFTFDRDGTRIDESLTPLTTSEYHTEFADPLHGHNPSSLPRRSHPLYLAGSGNELYVRKLAGGRALYVGFNTAGVATSQVAARLERRVRSRTVRRVIVDVRLNGGGNNTLYRPLFGVLASSRVNRAGRLFLLTGRATFSAAGNFATEIDRYTRATLVGEPTGGGVNQYGDATLSTLPVTGWQVSIATSYVVRGTAGDRRLAVVPDRRVDLRSSDFFAGRDPVLEWALRGL